MHALNKGCMVSLAGVGVVILLLAVWAEHDHQQTFHPFRVPVEKILVDYSDSCPNGDGQGFEVSQLKHFDTHKWVQEDNKRRNPKWIRGPVTDPEHLRVIEWACTPCDGYGEAERERAARHFTWQKWVKSSDVYFNFKDIGYWSGKSKDIDYANIWILDTRNNRMYFVHFSL